jgi:hypothetical protein
VRGEKTPRQTGKWVCIFTRQLRILLRVGEWLSAPLDYDDDDCGNNSYDHYDCNGCVVNNGHLGTVIKIPFLSSLFVFVAFTVVEAAPEQGVTDALFIPSHPTVHVLLRVELESLNLHTQ